MVQTPLLADERLDTKTMEREVDWIFDNGADGLTFAMVSEVLRFSESERRQIAEILCSLARGRGPVVISVCAESTAAAVDLAAHAERVGAQAVMAVAPLTVDVDVAELVKHFSAVADATSVPVVVQDASGYVGHAVPTAVYSELLSRFGERIMFKPEAQPIGQRFAELMSATRGAARAFEGTGGAALIETFPQGLVGTMPGADLCWAIRSLWDALVCKDMARAEEISLPLTSLIAIQTSLDAFVAIEKYLLHKQGVFHNEIMRGPLGYRLDQNSANRVDTLFERLRQACGLA